MRLVAVSFGTGGQLAEAVGILGWAGTPIVALERDDRSAQNGLAPEVGVA
jgi:hypothetical protein